MEITQTSPAAAIEKQSYADFEPLCQWQKHQEYDILEVHLPGFTRQDVRIQFTSSGLLTISGKQGCAADQSTTATTTTTTTNTRSRFYKEIKISKSCSPEEIRAKFSRGVLSVLLPKRDAKLSAQSNENSSKLSHYGLGLLGGIRTTNLSPKISKQNALLALKIVVVALAIGLAGYAVYKFQE